MGKALIHQPAKTAMQSGRGKSKKWVVEFPRSHKVAPEPLMGWQSSADTARQVALSDLAGGNRYCDATSITDLQNKITQAKTTRLCNFASEVFSWTH